MIRIIFDIQNKCVYLHRKSFNIDAFLVLVLLMIYEGLKLYRLNN